MTETIKVEVDEALARRFRRRAAEKFGYKKGNFKKAVEDAMKRYSPPMEADWAQVEGRLKSRGKGATSVSLQHQAWAGER
jgi:hypothetical protein